MKPKKIQKTEIKTNTSTTAFAIPTPTPTVSTSTTTISTKSNLIWHYEDLALKKTYFYIRKIFGITQTLDIIDQNTMEITFEHELDNKELMHISKCTNHTIEVSAYQMQIKTEVVHLKLRNAIYTQLPSIDEDDYGYLLVCNFASESPAQHKLVLGGKRGTK